MHLVFQWCVSEVVACIAYKTPIFDAMTITYLTYRIIFVSSFVFGSSFLSNCIFGVHLWETIFIDTSSDWRPYIKRSKRNVCCRFTPWSIAQYIRLLHILCALCPNHINILNVRQIWKENILSGVEHLVSSHRFVHMSIWISVHAIRFGFLHTSTAQATSSISIYNHASCEKRQMK